ncbi:homeodomain-like protein [Tanacetum coccineum]
MPHLVANKLDNPQWRNSDGSFSDFSIRNAWEAITQCWTEVDWFRIVWFPYCIPRHAFHLWLVMRKSLKTQDKLRPWDVGLDTDLNQIRCAFCDLQPDSHDHLFFECSYSLQPMAKKRTAQSIIGRLVFTASSYFIWNERNNHLFKNTRRRLEEIRDLIMAAADAMWISLMRRLRRKRKLLKNVQQTTTQFRKLLSIEWSPPIEEVIQRICHSFREPCLNVKGYLENAYVHPVFWSKDRWDGTDDGINDEESQKEPPLVSTKRPSRTNTPWLSFQCIVKHVELSHKDTELRLLEILHVILVSTYYMQIFSLDQEFESTGDPYWVFRAKEYLINVRGRGSFGASRRQIGGRGRGRGRKFGVHKFADELDNELEDYPASPPHPPALSSSTSPPTPPITNNYNDPTTVDLEHGFVSHGSDLNSGRSYKKRLFSSSRQSGSSLPPVVEEFP